MSDNRKYIGDEIIWTGDEFRVVSIFQHEDGLYYIEGDDPTRFGPFATKEEIISDVMEFAEMQRRAEDEYDEYYDPETDEWPNG